jgi:hypothetical protein
MCLIILIVALATIPNANGQRQFLAVLHTLGLVLALISVAVSAVWGSLEA